MPGCSGGKAHATRLSRQGFVASLNDKAWLPFAGGNDSYSFGVSTGRSIGVHGEIQSVLASLSGNTLDREMHFCH
jgi:hypothetical protein